MGEATLASRQKMLDAKMRVADDDREGIETEGEALPGEMYSTTRKWVSTEYRDAEAELKGNYCVPRK